MSNHGDFDILPGVAILKENNYLIIENNFNKNKL